ncbi:hypothetical protein GCU56_06865 [Geodermatophilus sabuli]|uniref:DUF6779 domain-containing protein n=1 Tax=Geodermatophilus sabuli TaxID=1564158 RepID=A0A7K3VYB8_9ACTN|nr:DUF6779 domain-containing protein [Geodermatophilus sabuli]NEK57592.1 hypothetical protein [Geodermatophilus sabuli]
MRMDRDDPTTGRSRPGAQPAGSSSVLRTAGLLVGFLLAVGATVVVFVTENPQLLRLAVVGAAWAFVLAALAGTRRGPEPAEGRPDVQAVERAAADREAELRLAYELELEREAAERRADGLRLENDLRREAEQSMRTELTALRGELARVAELRHEVAEIAGLRGDLAEVGELRREMARLTELRGDLAQLTELRADLTQLTELRADMGRLRTELTEQLSGEMLIERIMLRTQSIRSGSPTVETPATRTIDASGWAAPAHDLTGHRSPHSDTGSGGETRQWDEVRVQRPAEQERTAAFATPVPPPQPWDWLAERSLIDAPEPAPEPAPAADPDTRRRRTDDLLRPAVPSPEQFTVERPVAQRDRPPVPSHDDPPAPQGSARLAEILAESAPPSGGRRRRRYRDEDDSDDVLSRVLGR